MRSIIVCKHFSAATKHINIAPNTQDVNCCVGGVYTDVVKQVHALLAFLLHELIRTMLMRAAARVEHGLVAIGRMVSHIKEIVEMTMTRKPADKLATRILKSLNRKQEFCRENKTCITR